MDEDEWIDLAVEAGQLREAMATRAPIEQAKGVLMAAYRCDAAAAFALLRQTSMACNVKLTALAEALLCVVRSERTESAAAEAAARSMLTPHAGRAEDDASGATA